MARRGDHESTDFISPPSPLGFGEKGEQLVYCMSILPFFTVSLFVVAFSSTVVDLVDHVNPSDNVPQCAGRV